MSKLRRKWRIHPVTRVKQSDRHYDRNKMKKDTQKEIENYKEGDNKSCPKCCSENVICYAKLCHEYPIIKWYHRCNDCLHIFIEYHDN